ncbi:dermonecrotic toxin domain-containing protein [Pseudomonas fluorescens]|uniref:Dermonecrotic toxin N-terminal domain-containing protein n=1 Tax=Pseudomonas fluorescens TaxID=294 RepID=A0A5E7AQL5_PSEFL|nr:DUF6543 domain-containing protein [Pseudomonas fluorescens]VVN79054.1 hypothetical protein PS833_00954 [Pseudomonas fluorescens]
MPDPNTPALSTTLSQLPAQAIHERFAHRPALFSVVFNTLRERILERYPTLELDLLTTKLASPHPSGVYTFELLTSVAIAHVLHPRLLDLHSHRELPFYLTQKIPTRLKPAVLPHIDMQVIAQIIDALPATLYLYFQQALADYWSEVDSDGISRWQWLAEVLNGQVTAAAAGRSHLSQTQQDMLSLVAACPDRLKRISGTTPFTYAYFIETTLTRDQQQVNLLTPDLLLIRDRQVLLCGLGGAVETYDSIEAFGSAWGTRMQRQFQFDSMTWRRNEPDGNVFEQQAGLILNQQLEDLQAFNFRDNSEIALERRLEKITDPALLFTKAPAASPALLQKVNNQLPEWLKRADSGDRFAYHRHLQDMAQVLKQNRGRSYNEGIENIHDFSRDALRKQLQTDHAEYDPDDVVLDFSVAAGYPGGAGIIEHVRMSLTELALKNLAGKPKGTLALSSKNGKTLPSWLNDDYLLGSTGLISRVDIGTIYPQKINELLLSDTADARRRETLFTRELKVKLPMLALEYKIRKLYGVSAKGYRYVTALLGETSSDRIADDQEIVLRPLSLCRKPGAVPDQVNNIFIIEPRDTDVGPHLLYRPLYAESLQEYPTRQALLDAIATPGELQDSVLTWLTDKARPIYDHGGIKEPHLLHFLSGDEFGFYEKPAPATLAVDEGAEEWLHAHVNGTLLNQLFSSTARALVDLADRDSVSNSESRWAILMEGAWLLFNTLLLPLIQGPAMLAGWFLVLVSSLEQDLAGLDSVDPTTREQALIDLLLNTAMILLHAATPSNRSRQPLADPAPQDRELHLADWRHVENALSRPHSTPVVRQDSTALPGMPPSNGHTTVDFGRSIASATASTRLLDALLAVNVPWPETLPIAQASGPYKGLYRIANTWHASVGGLLFQVSIEPGFAEVYLVDPKRPLHPGFKLASDGQGHWRLDRGVKLEGGMPKDKFKVWNKAREKRVEVLETDLMRIRAEYTDLDDSVASTLETLKSASDTLESQRTKLKQLWKLRRTAIEALKETITARHEQQQVDTAQAKVHWGIAFHDHHEKFSAFLPMARQLIDKLTELMAVDRTEESYRQNRDQIVQQIFSGWVNIYDYLGAERAFVGESERGESSSERFMRIEEELDQDITVAYEMFIDKRKAQLDIEKKCIEPATEIRKLLDQADPHQRQRLLNDAPAHIKYISTTTILHEELLILIELVLNRAFFSEEPLEMHFVNQLSNNQSYQSILVHLEMSETDGYSASEQRAVLMDIAAVYERMENAVNSLTDMRSGHLRDEFTSPFLKSLSEARTSLDTQLADLILIDEGFAPVSKPSRPTRTKPATRKVIKTLDRGSLVGDLRQSNPEQPGNFVDIKDPITGQTVATYLEHASEGVWKQLVAAPPPQEPVPAPAVRSLKKIKAAGDTIMGERTGIESSIRFQQQKLLDPSRREGLEPQDWELMLTQHAQALEALANEINRDHATDASAGELRSMYLDEVKAVKLRAREVCAEGYKLQRPKDSRIEYLRVNGFVDINLVRSRIPLKAGDYLTEYAVRDKNKIKEGKKGEANVLWYAHFHYPAVDTPALQPEYGHLKTIEERRFTRKELMEKARADNRVVVYLEKAEIAPALAEKLFLKLEPPLPKAD